VFTKKLLRLGYSAKVTRGGSCDQVQCMCTDVYHRQTHFLLIPGINCKLRHDFVLSAVALSMQLSQLRTRNFYSGKNMKDFLCKSKNQAKQRPGEPAASDTCISNNYRDHFVRLP